MNVAIIVAAGRGTRMKDESGVPKQFRLLAGEPLVIHTLCRFERASMIDEMILVVPSESRDEIENLTALYSLGKLRAVVAGGYTRSVSVQCGLAMLQADETGIVAVHDGARPFVTAAEIDSVVSAAKESGAAILASRAVDTIKEVEGDCVVRTLARQNLRHALTPQAFRYELLVEAYGAAERNGISDATDDSALVEQLGIRVRIVEGNPRNIKITRPEDWAVAERMIEGHGSESQRSESQRSEGDKL